MEFFHPAPAPLSENVGFYENVCFPWADCNFSDECAERSSFKRFNRLWAIFVDAAEVDSTLAKMFTCDPQKLKAKFNAFKNKLCKSRPTLLEAMISMETFGLMPSYLTTQGGCNCEGKVIPMLKFMKLEFIINYEDVLPDRATETEKREVAQIESTIASLLMAKSPLVNLEDKTLCASVGVSKLVTNNLDLYRYLNKTSAPKLWLAVELARTVTLQWPVKDCYDTVKYFMCSHFQEHLWRFLGKVPVSNFIIRLFADIKKAAIELTSKSDKILHMRAAVIAQIKNATLSIQRDYFDKFIVDVDGDIVDCIQRVVHLKRTQWGSERQKIHAIDINNSSGSYDSLHNCIQISPAEWYVDDTMRGAAHLGHIIAHELGHAIDMQLSGDLMFREELVRLYDQCEGLSYGEQTLAENVADFLSIPIAYRACASRSDFDARIFFTEFALFFAVAGPVEQIRKKYASDTHALPHLRVELPLANFDAWYETYQVGPAHVNFVSPERRIRIL